MQSVVALLSGVIIGGLVVRALTLHAVRRAMRPFDEQYTAARRAVRRHFTTHDTLNIAQLERLMDANATTAERYLDRMVSDDAIKVHGHRGVGAFYTRV